MNARAFNRFLLTSVLAGVVAPVGAQTTNPPVGAQTTNPPVGAQTPTPPQTANPCSTPERAQFDFWIGEWVVEAGGQLAGTNSISREYGGCVLIERWTGAKGLTGSSFNLYLPAARQWHQTWVDSTGSLLQLYGEFKDGAMRLASRAEGKGPLHRITWTAQAGGTVRQLWETSTDGGANWSVAFDGLYRRKSSKDAAARD